MSGGGLGDTVRRVVGLPMKGERTRGRPRSANRASSFHLWWELPHSGPLVEVSAVLEIPGTPAVPDLYFWALQVSFERQGQVLGGGHTGLQWHPSYPAYGAVNWGGYRSSAEGGGPLPGTPSSLPGLTGEPNTRAFPWKPATPYRFRISRSPEHRGAWRAEVTDLTDGVRTVIRDLFADAPHLAAPVVWSEVFADCDAPGVTARWSHLEAIDEEGAMVSPRALRVTYQSYEEGGCTNTTVTHEGTAVLQTTNVPRTMSHNTRLPGLGNT